MYKTASFPYAFANIAFSTVLIFILLKIKKICHYSSISHLLSETEHLYVFKGHLYLLCVILCLSFAHFSIGL